MNEAEQDDRDNPFLMLIHDVVSIKGRGLTAVVHVQQGVARKGDAVDIGYFGHLPIRTRITAFEGFIKDPDNYWVELGDSAAILLREIQPNQIEPGMVMAAPGSLSHWNSEEER